MKSLNIFLDDIRQPNMSHNNDKGLGDEYSLANKWIIVRDYFDFVDVINKQFDDIKLISYDHDLACIKDGKEYTGKDAVDYLINHCLDNNKKFPDWYVHTDNTVGCQNIIGAITNYLKNIEGVDFSDFRYYHKGYINGKFI